MPTTRRIRHLVGLVAAGVTLSVGTVAVTPPLHATSPATPVTGLARGARGEAVRHLQRALVNQGVSVTGGVDGIFGPGTEAALKRFQTAKGLPATGVVDDASAIALGLASNPFLGLTQGSRGDLVRRLQQGLITAGLAPVGGADGIFGPGTKASLQAFQKRHGVPQTGVVDAATAALLGGASAPADTPSATPAPEPAPGPAADSSALVGTKIGARGESVKRIQRTIMSAGFTVVGGADGIFGVLTANAVRSFQNANGLEVTGVVDAATAEVLERLERAPTAPSGDAETDGGRAASPLLGLRYGSIGDDVKALQQTLLDAGVKVRGGADGVFGTATLGALKEYQAARGLSVSGKVDEATARALATKPSAPSAAIVGLRAGSLGNTVKKLQQQLIDAGVKVRGGADGIFGPATAAALKEFQSSQGLDATGIVDDATAAALAAPKPAAPAPDAAAGGYAEYGEKGQRVMALQSALVKAGITVRGGVDGMFGGGTSAAVMEFQRQRGFHVTGKVDAATAAALGLQKAAAPTAGDPATVKLGAFPVQGKCYYGDSWGFPRSGGRVHLGVDIIAPTGKLLYAVADGTITKIYANHPGSLSGNGIRLTTADGTYFFYAHMQGIADGIELGSKVKAGQIVGTVGSTGNSGTPHLHLEIHPQGGSAINPYPLVKAIDGCGVTAPLPQP